MTTKWASCSEPIVRFPLKSLGEKESVLMEDWHVDRAGGLMFVVVPAGTTTDGASIPRFLWFVCGHPHEVPRAYAALFHDWCYRNGWKCGIDRKTADKCYYALERHFGISVWRAGIEYQALRFFGKRHYNKGNQK